MLRFFLKLEQRRCTRRIALIHRCYPMLCRPNCFLALLTNITQHTSAWKRILYNLAVEFTACVRFKSEKRQSGSNFSLKWWNAQGLPIMMTEYGADTVAGLRDSMPVMFTEEYQVARNTRWPITKCITKFSILWTTLSENMHGILQILPHARPSAVFRAIRKVFLQETAVQKWQLITLNSAGKISRTLITNKPVSKTQRQQGIRPDALPLPPLLPQLFFHFLPVFFGRHAVGLFKKPEKR